jgi:hypothetical protein
MGRKRQLGVALDDQLRSLLESLASKSDRSIADEIRSRIERTIELDTLPPLVDAASKSNRSIQAEVTRRLMHTFDQDLFDPATRELAIHIMELARGIQENSGCRWDEQPKAHEALVEGVTTLIEGLKPPATAEDQWGQDDPRTVGRLLARSTLRRREEAERDEQATSLQLERLREQMTARQVEVEAIAKRHAAAVERMIAKPSAARSKKGRKS